MDTINKDGRIHMVAGEDPKVPYYLRFAICGSKTESRNIKFSFDTIRELALKVLLEE